MTFNSSILIPILSQRTQKNYEQALFKLKLLKWRSSFFFEVETSFTMITISESSEVGQNKGMVSLQVSSFFCSWFSGKLLELNGSNVAKYVTVCVCSFLQLKRNNKVVFTYLKTELRTQLTWKMYKRTNVSDTHNSYKKIDSR